MRALKALVIVMGVLIILGMALVGYTIVKRTTEPVTVSRAGTEASSQQTAGVLGKTPYGPIGIELPPGSRVLRTTATDRRLVVEVELSSGGERVLIVDPANGALLGTIELQPKQ